jgi:hypothetical protein
MALVDQIADGLADKVVADGITLKAVLAQDLPAALDVTVVRQRPLHVEVIPPAGELQAVVAPLLG